jgi:hypothetical protein
MYINMYLVEVFGPFAASAVVAGRILQSLAGAFYRWSDSLYRELGYGLGNSVPAIISLPMLPVPWLFYRYGPFLTTKFKISL